MQLDLFEHSRDVVLRNAVIEALRSHDVDAAAEAIARLETGNRGDPWLDALTALNGRLRLKLSAMPDRAAAAEAMHATERVVPLARQVFGEGANAWLAPLWADLAVAVACQPFDASDEQLHAAPIWLRAGRWREAQACVETIPAWRSRSAPLAWGVESVCRRDGFDAAWPMFCELTWMAPQRAAALAPRLHARALDVLVARFDAEFEGEGTPADIAWFPAWAQIVEPGLAAGVRAAMRGATPAEHGARLMTELLRCEREGRHADLIEGRRKLRVAHPALFALYMRTR